jgi:5'-3' exonuclease
MNGLLVENGSINHKTLTEIFISLSKTEDSDLLNIIDSYINKKVHNSNIESDYYAIKHKDNIAKQIYSNTKEWRYIYYKYKFNSNIYIDSSVINIACKKYIEGIYWTYMYYKYYIIDHKWYYPFNHPPIIKDISNHCIGNEAPDIKSNGTFINNDVQLLLVLPVQSNNLLKKKFKSYTENENKGLLHLFPHKYNIDTFLKTHLWECYPNLPKINIEHIKNILNI